MERILSATELQFIENFYGPLMGAGIRTIGLAPGEKQVPRGTIWEQNVLDNVSQVKSTLQSGGNVGLLLQGKRGIHPNPPGLVIIDQDSERALAHCDFDPFMIMVSRGVPNRAHYYGLMANPTMPRRSRHVQNSHDVKLTGLVVGPLSVHRDGSVYEAFHRSGPGQAWVPWSGQKLVVGTLPKIDPFHYMALANNPNLKPRDSLTGMPLAVRATIGAPDGRMTASFITCSRPLNERKFRAIGYLRNRIEAGDVSRSGMGGRATLQFIAVHLLVYLNLPKGFCLAALNKRVYKGKSWNGWCIDAATGRAFPWSDAELNAALDEAASKVPNFGVLEWERLQLRTEGQRCFEDFLKRINWHAAGVGFHQDVAPEALYGAFLTAYDLPEEALKYVPFTRHMAAAIECGRVRLKRIRLMHPKRLVYRGLQVNIFIQLIARGILRFLESMGLSRRA